MVMISIVVAAATNNVIGKNNTLPWHIPADLKRFKAITMGHALIMGRKTYESIGRPLPGRKSIVVSRQSNWVRPLGVDVVDSLEKAIRIANDFVASNNVTEIMVVGGAEIYRQCLPLCQKVYLTEVQAEILGDSYFPNLSEQEWREVQREDHDDIEGNSPPFSFVIKERIGSKMPPSTG